jgi:hypothetical protein
MLSLLAFLAFLGFVELAGITLTYIVCYRWHGGHPEDDIYTLSGWKGGDWVVMLIAWPVTLVYYGLKVWFNQVAQWFDKSKTLKTPKVKHIVESDNLTLRSGQDNGLYDN